MRKLARLLASSVADDWPMPTWLRSRIQAIPAVAEQLRTCRQLENRLRQDGCLLHDSWEPTEGSNAWSQSVQLPVRQRAMKRPFVALVAVVATILVFAGMRMQGFRQQQNELTYLTVNGETIDVRPVLASLVAGQEVASGITDGLRDLSSQFLVAGECVEKQLAELRSIRFYVKGMSEIQDDTNGVQDTSPLPN